MDRFTKITTEKISDEAELESFNIDYREDSVFTKNPIRNDSSSENTEPVTGKLFQKFEIWLNTASKDSQIAKRLKVMLKFFKVKDTLSRLNKINKSVDELVNLKVPFGEQDKRYQILANRLIRANHLHTQIQKELS